MIIEKYGKRLNIELETIDMNHRWYQDKDGTYYIKSEIEEEDDREATSEEVTEIKQMIANPGAIRPNPTNDPRQQGPI